jgi:hypothetical protein
VGVAVQAETQWYVEVKTVERVYVLRQT